MYRSEASTGGVDILGFLTRKYYHISVSTTNFLFDTCVMAAAVVFLGLTPVLYSMVLFFITLKATNLFMVGFDYKKQVLIISTHAEEISRRIMDEVNRGVTLLDGKGAWSGQEKRIILCAFGRRHFIPIKKLVQSIDPDAFVIVCDAHEVLGEGFGQYDPTGL